ncbi:MAG: PAS domain S-box protein [Acidobacteria bacterium]|nr:PAS domain S-box protein [Acidobacteriota bacterium]
MKITGAAIKAFLVVALTVGAVLFVAMNTRDRVKAPPTPDDGVVWVATEEGVTALDVRSGSPAFNAGIRPGQILRYIYHDGAWEYIERPDDVAYYLDDVGINGNLVYEVERFNSLGVSQGLWEGDVKQIEPAPLRRVETFYFGLIAIVYLIIGVFVFLRQGRAPYSFHFFWICLTAFLFYALKPTLTVGPDGEWELFDRCVLLVDHVAFLLAAPLFVHFCMVFPSKPEWLSVRWLSPSALYIPAVTMGVAEAVLLFGQNLAGDYLVAGRSLLDTVGVGQFAIGAVAADVLLVNSYLRARTPALRLQLRWIMWGVALAAGAFAVFYAIPYLLGQAVSTASEVLGLGPLILVPLSFGYSIVRYRMMDVDVIVRRSFVHVVATATVAALYLLLLLTVGDVVKEINPTASTWVVRAVTVAVMLLITILFAPVKTWLQQTADRLFYGERYTLRKGLGEFGRALASTSELDSLLASLAARLRRMLSADQLAIVVENAHQTGRFDVLLADGIDGDIRIPSDFSRWVRANAVMRGYALADESGQDAEWAGVHYLVPCVVRDRLVAVIGIGRQTSDGSLLTSEDIEILRALSGYVAVAIDNSLLLQSEREKSEALAHLQQFSASIIESVNVGILVIDSSGIITTWNSALEEMLGIGRDEALGSSALQIFNEEMITTLRAVTGTAAWVVGDVRHLYKFRTVRRDDRPIVINLSLAPFEDTAHTLAGTLVVVEDVTDRLKLEDQLQQSDKLSSIGLLAAGVAHEVNTPLAGISSYTQMLLGQIPDSDPKSRLLEKVLLQTERASGIVNNLLNFSRTSGSDFAALDLNRVLEDTLQLMEIQLHKSNVTIKRTYAEELPEAYGNASKLQQVFMNLILNARDAMASGGTLDIETETADHMLVVRIRDTGIGIAAENITKIYDPFYTTKSVGQGTGLGLAVSYGIVQEHAGRIFVDSQPGVGTTFTIKIPSRYRRLQVASD